MYAPLESAGDTTAAQAVRSLSERVDRELDALRNSSEQQGASLQLLQQKCLEVTGRVDEWDDQNADLEMPGEGSEEDVINYAWKDSSSWRTLSVSSLSTWLTFDA